MDFDGDRGRSWDASSYDSLASPMTEMARAVLDRLPLTGDEVVMDAGCGTGRVTELLLGHLPRGRVLAVDADPDMVRIAAQNLDRPEFAGRVEVDRVDLLRLDLDAAVDAVLSTATFHWVLDHPALFQQIYRALRPGGRLVAQCGGSGNIGELRRIGEEVGRRDEFAEWLRDWEPPWYYADPEETADRLQTVGFEEVSTWLQPWPVVPEDPAQYLATITHGAQVQRLPEHLRDRYVEAILDESSAPFTVEYVRLNVDARRP